MIMTVAESILRTVMMPYRAALASGRQEQSRILPLSVNILSARFQRPQT
jgi:hypothetical protein